MEASAHPPERVLNEEGAGRRHGRRRRQLTGLAAGLVLGWAIGFAVEYAVGSRLTTGSVSDPFTVAFGLPAAVAVAFGLFGLLLGTTSEVQVVDAPVRDPRYERAGRAAASERGQTHAAADAPRPPADSRRH
jgi:hypothetical protein